MTDTENTINQTTGNQTTGNQTTGTQTTGTQTTGTQTTATTDAAASERSARKVREGIVTSASMDKTITVTITERVKHAKYAKIVQRDKKLYAHDETNDAGIGDKVRVMETRPLSKNKRWRLVEVLERAR